jgi:CubicO group peptidase (beta-lactamase class C family)
MALRSACEGFAMSVYRQRFCALLLAFALLPALSSSVGAAEVPAGSSGPRAQDAVDEWLAAFNAGSLDGLQAFADRYAKKAGSGPQDYLEFRASSGPMKVLDVRSSTPEKVEVLVLGENSERAMLLTAEMDPAAPRHVKLFQLEGVPTPQQFQPARMELPALLGEITARLNALQAADALSGAVLVAHDGKVLMQWQGGLANREQRVPVDAQTQFRLASSNKMFTAVAILQLAEAGRLTLDDTIGKRLADYPNEGVAGTVTIRQLLNHTSGLGDFFGDDFEHYAASLRTHDDYVQHFAKDPPQFSAGSQDGYSNYGFIVLGRIIEVVSGQTYYHYVNDHILRAAGMTATGFEPESVDVPHRTPGYTRVKGQWLSETRSLPWRGTAAGGGYSTVGDMLKFAEALRAGTLVSPAWLQQATRPQNNKGWYGYGFMVQGEGRQRQFGHEGGAPGSNSAIVVMPEQGYVLIGLANVDPDAMGNVINYIARRVPL